MDIIPDLYGYFIYIYGQFIRFYITLNRGEGYHKPISILKEDLEKGRGRGLLSIPPPHPLNIFTIETLRSKDDKSCECILDKVSPGIIPKPGSINTPKFSYQMTGYVKYRSKFLTSSETMPNVKLSF